MGTGSEYTTGNKTGSFSSINHKTRLLDSGSAIEAATKVGGGQEAYVTATSSGKIKGTDLITDPTGTIWANKISNLLNFTKWGVIWPVTTLFADNSHGIWAGSTVTGSSSIAALDTNDGLAGIHTTGAGAGNQAGVNRALLFTARILNPCFKLKWKTDEAGANIRFFAGWTSSTSIIGNNDDPLNAISGFGISMHTGQTNYQIMSNDGAGATVLTDTGVAKDTTYHIVELWADETNTRFLWSLDGSTPAAITTDIPASTTGLSCQYTVTAVNADAKPLNIQRSIITSDR